MDVREVLKIVNAMRADGVIDQYAIGGAVAASFYLEPVSTLDLDIFIAVRQEPGQLLLSLEPIFAYLKQRGALVQGEYVLIADTAVQFLPPNSPLVQEALEQALEKTLFDAAGISLTTHVFSPEHSAAIALETGRQKDKLRLLQFLQTEDVLDLQRFAAIVERHRLTDRWGEFQRRFLSEP